MYISTETKNIIRNILLIIIVIVAWLVGCHFQRHDTVKCQWDNDSKCFEQLNTHRIIFVSEDMEKGLTNGNYYVTIDNNNTETFEDDVVIKINRAEN